MHGNIGVYGAFFNKIKDLLTDTVYISCLGRIRKIASGKSGVIKITVKAVGNVASGIDTKFHTLPRIQMRNHILWDIAGSRRRGHI